MIWRFWEAMLPKSRMTCLDSQWSGQIIATSHDLTPNGGLVREIPLFQGNLGWWNIIIWPEWLKLLGEVYSFQFIPYPWSMSQNTARITPDRKPRGRGVISQKYPPVEYI